MQNVYQAEQSFGTKTKTIIFSTKLVNICILKNLKAQFRRKKKIHLTNSSGLGWEEKIRKVILEKDKQFWVKVDFYFANHNLN